MPVPIVAIVGRPNVGKSTLFNRLTGERLAIVEDLPGTTRDRLYAEAQWDGREFTVVDTGGLETAPETAIASQVRDQVQVAIREADVVVFVVDAITGVTQVDLEIAELLRRARKPLVVTANKAESARVREEAFQFHELGLEEPIAVSAKHGVGTGDLLDAIVAALPPAEEVAAETGAIKVAVAGRPNVGKSMLFNALLGEERVIVSDVPGTTRDAIDTVLNRDGTAYLLIDTAGMRRRGHVDVGIEKYSVMRALRAVNRADVVLLLVDAAEGITAQDTHVAGYIHEATKGVIVVVNKWDLMKGTEATTADFTRLLREQLKFMPYAPILYVSAKTHHNVDKILPLVQRVYQMRTTRVPTSGLNQVISRAVAEHAPPSVRGKRLKVYYVTQANVNPPTFVFFVNEPRLLHFSYERYLENELRSVFGFEGTAIKMVFRKRGEEQEQS